MVNRLKQIALLLIVGTFFVPTIVIPSSFIFPFIVPKVLAFRILAALLVAVLVLLGVSEKKYRLEATPVTLSVLAFLASFTISTFFGTDAYHSFWDNHERMLGLFTLIHYAAYYLAVTTIVSSWTEWKWLLRIFLLAGTIVSILGLAQIINPDFLLNQGSDRVSSTLGNAIYLGGYGLFLVVVSALLWFKDKQNTLWRGLYIVTALLAIGAMYASATRGSFLGLGAGIITALILYTVLYWRTSPGLAKKSAAVVVAFFILLGLGYVFRATATVQSIPMIGRILNSSLSSGTGSTRLIAWQIAVKSWYQHPIFGWGPNNFFYAFNQYYNPESLRYGFGETWFDNAHNIVLNTLTVQGIVGVITYLGMFGAGAWVLLRNKELRVKQPEIVIISAAYLAAHLIENLTVFENPTSYLVFMFWLAFINKESLKLSKPTDGPGLAGKPTVLPNAAPQTQKISLAVVSICAVVAGGWIYLFNLEPAWANVDTLNALNTLGSDPTAAIPLIQNILRSNTPHIDDIRSDVARSTITVLDQGGQTLGSDVSLQLFKPVYEALQENIALHPLDIRNYLTLAQLGQMGYLVTKNPTYILQAEKYLTQALVYSPRRQQLVYSLAGIKAQLGKKDEAIALLQGAVNDAPGIGENYWRLAFLYEYLKDFPKAKETIDAAHSQNISFTVEALQMEQQINAALLKVSGTKK